MPHLSMVETAANNPLAAQIETAENQSAEYVSVGLVFRFLHIFTNFIVPLVYRIIIGR